MFICPAPSPHPDPNALIVEPTGEPPCPHPLSAGNHCKHILFCYLRVLKCDKNDPRIWQPALLRSEVGR